MTMTELLEAAAPVAVWNATFRADEQQRLPPLPTTALHGGFGHALRRLACIESERTVCGGCPQLQTCAYQTLFEPPAAPQSGPITTQAPSPIVFASESYEPEAPFCSLDVGAEWKVRVVVIGTQAQALVSLVASALRDAGAEGLAIKGHDRRRPRLSLRAFERIVPAIAPTSAPNTALLRFVTPARLKDSGEVRTTLDSTLVWRALERRIALLARVWGSQPDQRIATDSTAPWDGTVLDQRLVHVRRWSERQQQRMSWPALMGSLQLSGPGLAQCWPLLRYGELVQIGKGTSFGCGRFVLEC